MTFTLTVICRADDVVLVAKLVGAVEQMVTQGIGELEDTMLED